MSLVSVRAPAYNVRYKAHDPAKHLHNKWFVDHAISIGAKRIFAIDCPRSRLTEHALARIPWECHIDLVSLEKSPVRDKAIWHCCSADEFFASNRKPYDALWLDANGCFGSQLDTHLIPAIICLADTAVLYVTCSTRGGKPQTLARHFFGYKMHSTDAADHVEVSLQILHHLLTEFGYKYIDYSYCDYKSNTGSIMDLFMFVVKRS